MLTKVPPGRPPHGLRPADPQPLWKQRYLATATKELLRRARSGVKWSHERLAEQVIAVAVQHGVPPATVASLRISFSKYEHGHSVPNMRSRHLVAEALDGASPYFATYRTACGGFVVVDAIHQDFFPSLLTGLGLADAGLTDQYNLTIWPRMWEQFAVRFGERDRREWARVFADPPAGGYVLPVPSRREALTVRIEMFGLDVDPYFCW